MKKALILACLAVSAAACEKYVPVYAPRDDGRSVVLDLKGAIASGVDGMSANWEEGAQISAFVGYYTDSHQLNVQFTASSVNGASASFATKIKKVEEQSSYVALYPYSANAAYDAAQDTVGFSLPAVQTYAAGGVADGALPMIAKSSTTDLSFKQLCGVFRISLTGSDVKVNSIEVEALKIAGPCTVNAGTGAITMKPDATDKITLSFPETVTLGDTPTVFNVVVPPGSYSTVYYTIYAEDGSKMPAYDEDVVITGGAVTTASAAAFVPEAPEGVNPDLTADGYANCYLVTAPGKYNFKCGLPDGNGTIAKGTSAKWVWATSGAWASQEEASADKLVKDIAYDSENDRISFTVPEGYTYGNVLIALLDADNKISYGWHIWLTSPIKTVVVGGVEVMDRNLGAGGVLDVNSADISFINNTPGLTYQWGRKDAFPGPRGYIESSESTSFTPGMSTYYVTNSGIQNVKAYPAGGTDYPWTVANYTHDENISTTIEAGQHPCTNINNTPTGGGAAHPGYGLKQWAPEANPCPSGYRVISKDQMSALFGVSVTVNVVKSSQNSMVVSTMLNNVLSIPVSGYRNAGKLQKPSKAHLWIMDHTSTNDAHGYWGQIGPSSDGYVNHLKSDFANEIHSAFVRCVKN